MASDFSDDDLSDLEAVAVIMLLAPAEKKKRRKKRNCWVRPWISRRDNYGAYTALLQELQNEDHASYTNFLRMNRASFNELLERVSPFITKSDTAMRSAIPPGEKLAVVLRFLATGDSFKSLEYLYRIPKCTISGFVKEVCEAVYNTLRQDYLKVPSSQEEWMDIINDFEDKWQFPNCIGAIDGKHINIKAPKNSGSLYYNYKNFFSIVLLAMEDANYRFVFVDVGANGRASDAGIFANSSLFQALESNQLNIPPPSPLRGRDEPVPNVIVGDEAFPLKSYLLKPYPSKSLTPERKVFNYRLSRARRVSENAFGILSQRFAVFQRSICLEPATTEKVVLACVVLHNFLRTKNDNSYIDNMKRDSSIPGSVSMLPLTQQGGNRNTSNARDIRDEFLEYFSANGQVEWQWDYVV